MEQILNNLKIDQITYGEYKHWYCDLHNEPTQENRYNKYDIYNEICHMNMESSLQFVNKRIREIEMINKKFNTNNENSLHLEIVDSPSLLLNNSNVKLSNYEMRILIGYKGNFDRIDFHLNNLLNYSQYKIKSFERQIELENGILDNTNCKYSSSKCYKFLMELIDSKQPYFRVLKFMLMLLIKNKIGNINCHSLFKSLLSFAKFNKFNKFDKLSDTNLNDIKRGFIQMYGYNEILTLNNIDKIINNLKTWANELINTNIIEICTSWKKYKPKELFEIKKLSPLQLEIYCNMI